MKVAKTDIDSTKVKLVVSADQFDLTPIKDHVLGHFVSKVKVPGFRPGTAPIALVEKYADPQALNDEFIEHALRGLYGQAIDQEKLRPASRPEVSLKKFVPFTDMEFEVELETIGPIKLPSYKTFKLAKKPVEVSAKEVDEILKSLQQRAAKREEVERAAKNEDELIIDFNGKDKDGKVVPNTDGKDVPVIIGTKQFIPGFEEELIGLKAGDKKDFDITFPADYGVKAMQSKKVTFSVEVKKVSEVSEPKADDGFAVTVGPFKNLAELKADIKKQLKVEKETQSLRQYEDELLRKLAEKTVITIPKGLVDEQIQAAEDQEKRNLVNKGQTWQEHLDEEGVTEEQHRERQRPDAEMRVRIGLMLSEVAEQEKIEVTQDDIEARANLHKSQYENDPQMQAELDKEENKRDIGARLMTEKTVLKLIDYASK